MSDSGKRGKPTFHPDTDPSPGGDDGCFKKAWLLVFIIYFVSFLFFLVSSDGDPDVNLPVSVAVGLFWFFLLLVIYVLVARQKNKRLIEQHEQQQSSEDADAAFKDRAQEARYKKGAGPTKEGRRRKAEEGRQNNE